MTVFQGPILLIRTASIADWQYVVVQYCPYCEYARSSSDSVRLYCLNSEIVGIRYCRCRLVSVVAVLLEEPANIGNILGLCAADIIAITGITFCLAVIDSTLILRVLVPLKYILSNTPSILRV